MENKLIAFMLVKTSNMQPGSGFECLDIRKNEESKSNKNYYILGKSVRNLKEGHSAFGKVIRENLDNIGHVISCIVNRDALKFVYEDLSDNPFEDLTMENLISMFDEESKIQV